MELAILLETPARIPHRNRTLVGSGNAPEGTQIPTIKIGADRGTERNLLVLVFLPETMTPWIFR